MEIEFHDNMLRPYQQEFVDIFASEFAAGTRHVLIGPAGFGKGFAVAAAVSRLMAQGKLQRVLLLAPVSTIVQQWFHVFESWAHEAFVLDAREVRALREQYGTVPEETPGGLYVATAHLAARPDMESFFGGVPWDLVIWDALGRDDIGFRDVLGRAGQHPGLLFVGSLEEDGLEDVLPDARVFDWRAAAREMEITLSRGASPLLMRETRSYRSTEDEVGLARKVFDYAKGLGREDGLPLLAAGASSMSSLERLILPWLSRQSMAEHHGQIEDLLNDIERLHVESRVDCFVDVMKELHASSTHIVAFTEFRATASLLGAAVAELSLPNYTMYEQMPYEALDNAYRGFRTGGGVLLVTGSAPAGLPLDFVKVAVHYDLPLNAADFIRREGRYRRYRSDHPCRVILLQDEAEAHPLENVLQERIRNLDLLEPARPRDEDDLFDELMK